MVRFVFLSLVILTTFNSIISQVYNRNYLINNFHLNNVVSFDNKLLNGVNELLELPKPKIIVLTDLVNLRVKVGSFYDGVIVLINDGDANSILDNINFVNQSNFSIITPINYPYQITPGETLRITIRFKPIAPCIEKVNTLIKATGFGNNQNISSDTLIQFSGIGLIQTISTKSSEIFMGAKYINTPIDSSTYDFIGVYDFTGNTDGCIINTTIDSIVISDPTNSFKLISPDLSTFPRLLRVDQFMSFSIRFQPQIIGNLNSELRFYFGGSKDSFRIVNLTGRCYNEYIKLGANLGKPITGIPGELIRIPIVVSGDLTRANINLLELTLKFGKGILKPKAIYPIQKGVIAEPVLPYRFDDPYTAGIAKIRLTKGSAFISGTLAEVEFAVMIGDTSATNISYKVIQNVYRPEVIFETDQVLFSQENFCDKPERIIRYDAFNKLSAIYNNSNGNLEVDFYANENNKLVNIYIHNIIGELVYSNLIFSTLGKNSFEFNSQVFPIGFYFLVVKQNDIAETIKVLIDR
ncbi:MAG: hypothetical protein IPP08_06025 [Chlorobiota bacterium]|nr:MAG: hypothetical protein IPP08_06025 [Chlorobiota bacterium]